MKYIVSRYNQDVQWLEEYTNDVFMYDRSEMPLSPLPSYIKHSTIVENRGSDWYDKFTYIIDNYDDLPDVAVYTKANLFKYITKEEFDKVKDNKTFTPLLTQNHKVYEPICRYKDGMYEEINNRWYLATHPCQNDTTEMELMVMLGLSDKEYVQFAPGSNYILTKEVIHRHTKQFYVKLRSYLDWDRYPGEAQLMERGAYYLWS